MPQIQVGDLAIAVTRKNIKNLHLRVYPPHGEVKISAPRQMSEATLREVIQAKLPWIEKQQAKLRNQTLPIPQHYCSGEFHRFRGQAYPLQVLPTMGAPWAQLTDDILELHIAAKSTLEQRQQVLNYWYRSQLKLRVPPLLAQWQPIMGVTVQEWRIKRMKTRWGTCNIQAQRIWLNLELAKHSDRTLEYVLVHELTHLLERLHNARFHQLLDQFLPDWRSREAELKQFLITK
ncbi:MAG: M48 family metallopeptidase [Spirulina sp. SIO3F2]|nr:M48 family metallopeptidase [Spirulina sp. SIO3F2]